MDYGTFGYKDLVDEISSEFAKKKLAWWDPAVSEQAATASGTASAMSHGSPAARNGDVLAVMCFHKPLAAGESLSVDVLKNGVSILPAAYVITPSNQDPKGKTPIKFLQDASIQVGDVLTCTRAYTAGGAPTGTTNSVRVFWA